MMGNLSRWILKTTGWTLKNLPEEPVQSVVCVAPHTSNWDFIIGKLSYWAIDRKSSFLMKKSWFFFPLGNLLRSMGGYPVDRNRKSSVTQQMADAFKRGELQHLAITPEGTRKYVKNWKMGFYHIAKKAEIPIELAYFDYTKKEMGILEIFHPTDDEKADLKYIRSLYKNIKGRFPEKFHHSED